jgi:uncharacterized membrane protein YkvA (DUF1232 family)
VKNKFFDIALKTAARIAGKKGRIALLIGRLTYKVSQVNWQRVDTTSVKEKLLLLGRLAKAYATGKYRNIPWKSLLIILAAIIYFINPIDLIPDVVPVLGLSDDFGVLAWVYSSVNEEVEKFLTWEKSQVISI